MIRRQHGADFKITHDGQVDEKSENSGTDKIPEPYSHEEIKGPFVGHRNGFVADVALAAAQFYEVPGVEGQERQRHHLERGKHCCKGHCDVGLSGPVPVMSGADDPAAEVENRVQVYHPRRRDV